MSPRVVEDAAAGTAAVLLAVGALAIGRALHHLSDARGRAVASFAGGVSLAFVFLELFVELVEGTAHELHLRAGPEGVHTIASVILAGACVAFAASVFGERHRQRWQVYVALGPQIAYRAVVGAALNEELHLSTGAFIVFWLAMVLHLGVTEDRLEAIYPREHPLAWRLTAWGAPLAGAVLWGWAQPAVGAFYLLLALVAGATILGIFRDEIPSAKNAHVTALLAGVAVFGLIVQVRWWM